MGLPVAEQFSVRDSPTFSVRFSGATTKAGTAGRPRGDNIPSHSVNQTARETHPTNQRLYANEAKEEASVYLDVTCVSRGLTVTDLSTLSVKSKMRGKHYQASQWLYVNEAVHIAHTFFIFIIHITLC